MGDRSRMDNFHRAGRESLFDSFLDYVDRQNGQLVILGDFFELLRYPIGSILVRRRELLDRLAAMRAVYVPGNHDDDVFSMIDPYCPLHPFFTRITEPFTQRIGDRRFRFMHGHEIDPLMNAGWKNLGRMIGAVTHRYELRQESRAAIRSGLRRGALEIDDPMMRLRIRLRRRMTRALHEGRVRTSAEKVRLLTRQIRTQCMISHYYGDKTDDLYDVAIVGHTHYAATFGDWFFNSGSWTGRATNFLTISPHGQVELLDWTARGPQLKDEILAA
jgi:UDP-2,3-diacylglucosamine pyrophosphatase LpxH